METFIQHIVNRIDWSKPNELRNRCYVFPSKRAGYYFKLELQKRVGDQSIISPEILSIEEFVLKHTNRPLGDEISLIFHLYECYKKYEKGVTIEKFYSWGQVLLSDFDEIDRYLADSDAVYGGLENIQELDKTFGDSEEIEEAIQQFQKLFSNPETVLANRFFQNWSIIRKTYHDFSDQLKTTGLTYKGQAFRNLAEAMLGEGVPSINGYDSIDFIGFNALAKSEEQIIETLLKAGRASIYFDADKSYLEPENEEAGHFLRYYKNKWSYSTVYWVETDFLNTKSEIDVIGATQMVGQAKSAGVLLSKMDLSNAAVVLADENLLMPVLHSLPEQADGVNVTMGYPFRNTTVFSFLSLWFKLKINQSTQHGEACYRVEDVLAVFKNTLVNPIFPRISKRIGYNVKRLPGRWVPESVLKSEIGDSWLMMVFDPRKEAQAILQSMMDFLVRVFYHLKENNPDLADQEIIYYSVRHLRRFQENINGHNENIGLKLLFKLFQEAFRQLKIPFDSDPNQGLQIMGFLETRALDFEQVIVLGANETKIPKVRTGDSYIPFSVRKAFNLPTSDETESIYAYHFRRLLQRSKRTTIIYNTEVATDGSGEMSRFVLQLSELARSSNSINYNEKILRNPMQGFQTAIPPIVVNKTDQVLELLRKRYTINNEQNYSRLSPTSLSTYIDCSLKFYLKYVARVPEEELEIEDIDPRVFGKVVHRFLEKIYEPYLSDSDETVPIDFGQLTDQESFEGLLNEVLKEEKVIRDGNELQAKDRLVWGVIKKVVLKVLEHDRKERNLKILGLEKPVSKRLTIGDQQVELAGVADRIDKVDNRGEQVLRIIDYKTGKTELVSDRKAEIEDPEIYLDPYFREGKLRSGFQAYFYSSILRKEYDYPIKAAIFSTRTANAGPKFLRKDNPIPEHILATFEIKLGELVNQIFDPGVAFEQTSDESRCRICSYKTICRR